VPLRSGTDVAFLGGMIRYIIESGSWFRDYVIDYTNASFILDSDFDFKDGLFTGYDPKTRRYDKSSWKFQIDSATGSPRRDVTLKDPRCVFNVLKKHYDRYTLENVSSVTGVSSEDLLRVYEVFCATGRPEKAGTILYALGWTQHTVGVQIIRSAAIIQLLLGNIGVAGGGINALRGEPNVQGSTDHALLYDSLPGYHKSPQAQWQTLEDYNKANTPVSALKDSVNWWQNRPKYVASLLKAWYGDEATSKNDFCYGLLPKLEDHEDYSYMAIMDRVMDRLEDTREGMAVYQIKK
jgi:formate dehydrogenase major subunit